MQISVIALSEVRERFGKGVAMLVLGRKVGEIINIGDDISVMVVRIGPHSVRIGVTAPLGVKVLRSELVPDRKHNGGEQDERGE